MKKHEYYLQFWGEIENDELIEKDLGIKEKHFWFDTKEERKAFKKKLNAVAIKHRVTIAFGEEEGDSVRIKTIATMEFEYKGKKYPYTYNFGYAYPADSAHYMFEDGNYACDCNRSLFIADDNDFNELGCGDEIKMLNLKVTYE